MITVITLVNIHHHSYNVFLVVIVLRFPLLATLTSTIQYFHYSHHRYLPRLDLAAVLCPFVPSLTFPPQPGGLFILDAIRLHLLLEIACGWFTNAARRMQTTGLCRGSEQGEMPARSPAGSRVTQRAGSQAAGRADGAGRNRR